jgi:hypothetical protein
MGLSAQKRAYYEEHIQAWRHSGLSQEKYCEQANIAYGSFKSWPSKLKPNLWKQRSRNPKMLVPYCKYLYPIGFGLG